MKSLNLLELKSIIKSFIKKRNEIWDIIVYGSFVRGKETARDIDFAIILQKDISLDKKLKLAQEIKEILEKKIKEYKIDVKTIDIYDFLDAGFLARQGILAEGYSILKNMYLHDFLGFKAKAIIKYELKGLSPSNKKMLYYALKGRRGSKGFLEEIGGKLISKNVLEVPIKYYHKIEQIMLLHKVAFKSEFGMFYK